MDPKSVDCVIYHGDCSDGFGAAWAAWKLLGNRAEYHAATHGRSPPDVVGKRVIILDFAYDKKTTKRMIADAEELEMRDHHKSALIALEGVAKPDWFGLENSGCILAWNFFHPGIEPPKFLKYIENRDLGWKPGLAYGKEFSAAFDMVKFSFEEFDRMLLDSSVDECIKRGAHILPYADTVISKLCSHAVEKKLHGYDILVVNASHWISEIGMRLAPQCDFACVWHWNHLDGSAKISLRSFHPHIDCGTIAKRFGGGGHPQIAAFEYDGDIENLFRDAAEAPVEEEEEEEDEEDGVSLSHTSGSQEHIANGGKNGKFS